MKRLLCLLTALVLCGLIFASCQINVDIKNNGGNVSGSESVSEDESDDREEGLFYITLDYNGFDDKNEVKKITVKKGEKITGLPEIVNSSSKSDFEYWAYNGKKIKNGMVFDYNSDITVVACYAEWTDNY